MVLAPEHIIFQRFQQCYTKEYLRKFLVADLIVNLSILDPSLEVRLEVSPGDMPSTERKALNMEVLCFAKSPTVLPQVQGAGDIIVLHGAQVWMFAYHAQFIHMQSVAIVTDKY